MLRNDFPGPWKNFSLSVATSLRNFECPYGELDCKGLVTVLLITYLPIFRGVKLVTQRSRGFRNNKLHKKVSHRKSISEPGVNRMLTPPLMDYARNIGIDVALQWLFNGSSTFILGVVLAPSKIHLRVMSSTVVKIIPKDLPFRIARRRVGFET